jgi:hypothetical protein
MEERDYSITIPFAGAFFLGVHAKNEEEAKEKMYKLLQDIQLICNNKDIEYEWDVYEKMHQGNVAHYQHWELEIEEM